MPRGSRLVVASILAIIALSVLNVDAEARRRKRRVRVSRIVKQAQAAFDAGRYAEAIEQLARVPKRHRLAPRAAFLAAYSHYKLGAHDRAVGVLELLLGERNAIAEKMRAEAGILRAMIALEKQQWKEAQQQLQRVVSIGVMPWAQTAERLRRRADAELQQIQRAEQQRAEKLRLKKRQRDFDAAIAAAKKAIERRENGPARTALDRAESVWPRRAITRYYRGYLHYKQRQFQRAKVRLREALAIDPSDGWARYMLALSIHDGGDTGKGRSLLGTLAAKAHDDAVRQVAREALVRIETAAVPNGTTERGGLSVKLALGSGVDTNPAYLDETSGEDPALALEIAARLGFRHHLGRLCEVGIGGAVVERAYLAGAGGDAHHTEPRGWVSVAIVGGKQRRVSLASTYQYAFVLYDHSPLLSQHTGELALWLPLDSGRSARLDVALTGWGGFRGVHDAVYNYFEAIRAGGTGRLRLSLRRFTIDAGYGLLRDWATTVNNSFAHSVTKTTTTAPGKGPGKGIETTETTVENYETIYRTDYSLIEHGPSLWFEARLPWKLSLSAEGQLRWRSFDTADTVTRSDTNETEKLPRRSDLRLSVSAELARALPAGLAVVLRFEQLRNWSSVASSELDRNYARTVGELLLRWQWGAPR